MKKTWNKCLKSSEMQSPLEKNLFKNCKGKKTPTTLTEVSSLKLGETKKLAEAEHLLR